MVDTLIPILFIAAGNVVKVQICDTLFTFKFAYVYLYILNIYLRVIN